MLWGTWGGSGTVGESGYLMEAHLLGGVLSWGHPKQQNTGYTLGVVVDLKAIVVLAIRPKLRGAKKWDLISMFIHLRSTHCLLNRNCQIWMRLRGA